MKYIRTHKFSPTSLVIGVVTNGTYLDYTKFNLLQLFKVDINVSLDGPPQIHDKYRKFINNKKGSLEKIFKKLRTIPCSERKKIRIMTVVTPKTYKYLSDTLMFIKRLGFSDIKFLPTFQYDRWKNKDIAGFKKVVNDFKQNYNKIFLKTKTDEDLDILNPKMYTIKNGRIFRDSYMMQNCDKLCVDFKGDFYPCERLLGFSERKKHIWKFGNIDTHVNLSLREIMLKKIRHYIERSFPVVKLKEPYFCPLSFYFLAEQKDKYNRNDAIRYCLVISELYEKFSSK